MNRSHTIENALILLWTAALLWAAHETGMLQHAWKEFTR